MKPFPTRLGLIFTSVLALSASPAWGGDLNFGHLVSSIEQRYQIRHQHIPLIGFASFCARIVTHGGVRGLKLAEFENTGARVPADDFDSFIHDQIGETWSLIVRSHDRAAHEDTLIYARENGNRFVLLIADVENGELSLVKVGLDADRLPKWINEHDHDRRHETL